MSDATTLLKEFLGNIRDPEKASALFAEDGAFEMPFFVSLSLPDRFEGPEGVKGLITTVLEYYPDFELRTRTSPSSSRPRTRCSRNTLFTPPPQRRVDWPTTCS
jgi:hypothetical protein